MGGPSSRGLGVVAVYALVQLAERPDFTGEPPDHEPFVNSLVDRGLVLLDCGAMTPTLLTWDLVGVDVRLIDPALVVGDGAS